VSGPSSPPTNNGATNNGPVSGPSSPPAPSVSGPSSRSGRPPTLPRGLHLVPSDRQSPRPRTAPPLCRASETVLLQRISPAGLVYILCSRLAWSRGLAWSNARPGLEVIGQVSTNGVEQPILLQSQEPPEPLSQRPCPSVPEPLSQRGFFALREVISRERARQGRGASTDGVPLRGVSMDMPASPVGR
jgi:hypothetical protein